MDLYSACNAEESMGQVGAASTKHHLASKFSRGEVFMDLYSPTKVTQSLTSQWASQGEVMLYPHLV